MGEKGDAARAEKGDAARALSRNLQDAIERVRKDVERVEFWADAVVGFSQPVPDYDRNKMNVWLPPEQATTLGSKNSSNKPDTSTSAKPAPDEKSRTRQR